MAFHCLSPCQERIKAFCLPVGLCCHHRAQELSIQVSQLYLIEVSVNSFFTFPSLDQALSLKALLIKSQVF